jgi:hypothetical protein
VIASSCSVLVGGRPVASCTCCAVPAGPAAAEYLLPATTRGIAVQATAALSLLTGLWVALSPVFLTLQHGGANANVADVIAGLAAAGIGAFALASPRGFP